jgi:hypothetical protein
VAAQIPHPKVVPSFIYDGELPIDSNWGVEGGGEIHRRPPRCGRQVRRQRNETAAVADLPI